MPVGYLIFGGLLCFVVAGLNIIDDRPNAPRWLTQVSVGIGAMCMIAAVSTLILRIP